MYTLRQEAQEIESSLISIRRKLHANAEIAFNEVQTAKFIAETLKSLPGFQVYENIGKTGVVGILRGKNDRPCIALRADMDALPLTEAITDINAAFVSHNAGAMHACGHDGHVSMLLNFAKIIAPRAHELYGSLKFVFQPAEENGAGAEAMLKDNVLTIGDLDIDAFYGIHLWSGLKVGECISMPGPIMAGGDFFYLTVNGHGSAPHQTVDSIVVASHLVTALQTVVSRNIDPLKGAVLSIGKISAGTVANAIAASATLDGTMRFFDPAIGKILKTRLHEVCEGVAKTFKATIEIKYVDLFPPTINHPGPANLVYQSLSKIVGPSNIKDDRVMGSEDFSRFLHERPGSFFFVGCALPDGLDRPHHSPIFAVDERSLMVGTSVWLQLVEDLMVSGQGRNVTGQKKPNL
ncbi:hypothetical protein SmJEL517_g03882 [Synchytrium microbalum]|uniref:Peptidase M20 dimerisation domain-containing protein n=1 Tax=Synchytrium microbalum TaxID=1806994 RepID=A0A507C2I8_9FUNG|nr:uncharacterized protein SmJEL517_g03882 [Synchytrium microbalum]TPX33259.1 hypothetical protein SmJEL517_g03882 [Synchytrium microbalum]